MCYQMKMSDTRYNQERSRELKRQKKKPKSKTEKKKKQNGQLDNIT